MTDGADKPVADLRIRRTYKLLSDALFSLMEQKPLDEISVIDICDRAMVHRTTFYKHFEDKYDLLKYCIKSLQDSFDAAGLSGLNPQNPRTYYLNVIRQTLRFFREHRRMVLLLVNQKKFDTHFEVFHDQVSRDIQNKIREEEKKGVKFKVPIPILVEYYIGALMSLTLWWIRNPSACSEDQMVDYVDLLINVSGVVVIPHPD